MAMLNNQMVDEQNPGSLGTLNRWIDRDIVDILTINYQLFAVSKNLQLGGAAF
jgi:hypothetical protein